MTTIAYRDGVLASDSAAWDSNGIYFGDCRKIVRFCEGSLFGLSGPSWMLDVVANWLDGKSDRPDVDGRNAANRFDGLLIRIDGSRRRAGRIFHIDHNLEVSELINTDFTAIGSGREIALGAMAMGATAEQAIEIACMFSSGSRLPVQSLTIGT